MTKWFWGSAFLTLLFLSSCTKTDGPGSGLHATVMMRDGTSVAGAVTSSSATEIQMAGDDKVTRTIPMNQVRSVDYDDPVAGAPVATPPATAPPAHDRVHERHYHPTSRALLDYFPLPLQQLRKTRYNFANYAMR